MKAKFIRADGPHGLGLQFEPETIEEQLLLEIFTKESTGFSFEFSGWEMNGLGQIGRAHV